MRKSLVIITLVTVFFSMVGCSNSANNDLEVEKIEEQSVGSIEVEIETFEFKEAIVKSNLIAEIEIVESLEEIDVPLPKTKFKAEVLEVIKNDQEAEVETINVYQLGNGRWNVNNRQLFEVGDTYILFLMETVGLEEQSYWILGEETGVYQIISEEAIVKLVKRDSALNTIELPIIEKDIKENKIKTTANIEAFQAIDREKFKKMIRLKLIEI